MTGIVLAYNRLAEVGLIEDENGQRIKFYKQKRFLRGDLVYYEINMSDQGIAAQEIKHVAFGSEIENSVFLCSLY